MANRVSKPWYENAFWLTIAGSVIAIVGQLAGTIIPIMYGSPDVSDFSIEISPVGHDDLIKPVTTNEIYGDQYVTVTIKVKDAHHILRPYRFGVSLRASGAPEDAIITFDPKEIKAEENTIMIIFYPYNTKPGDYLITIQAIGSDGKLRNATYSLSIIHERIL